MLAEMLAEQIRPTIVFEANQACIAMVENPIVRVERCEDLLTVVRCLIAHLCDLFLIRHVFDGRAAKRAIWVRLLSPFVATN